MLYIVLVSIIIAVALYVIYGAVKRRVDETYALRNPNISTPLVEFSESNAISSEVSSSTVTPSSNSISTSISQRFEKMCLHEPLKYQNDPQLPEVIRQYKDLLDGKILDVEGRHVPSVTINGSPNSHYERYLIGQIKARKAAGLPDLSNSFGRELGRVHNQEKEAELRMQFVVQLMEMGIPTPVVLCLVTDQKLNTYSADDWKRISRAVKEHCNRYPAEVVSAFVSCYDQIDTLVNEDALSLYECYSRWGVPERIRDEIILGRVTTDQAERIVRLVHEQDYLWEDAFEEILSEDIKNAKEEELRDKYLEALL